MRAGQWRQKNQAHRFYTPVAWRNNKHKHVPSLLFFLFHAIAFISFTLRSLSRPSAGTPRTTVSTPGLSGHPLTDTALDMASTLTQESRDSLQIVLPGDLLPATESSLHEDSASAPIIKLGPGLQPLQDDTISAVKAGVLKHAEVGNRWWVESNQRRVRTVFFHGCWYLLLDVNLDTNTSSFSVVCGRSRRVHYWRCCRKDGRALQG